jgi:hypothetical protein
MDPPDKRANRKLAHCLNYPPLDKPSSGEESFYRRSNTCCVNFLESRLNA